MWLKSGGYIVIDQTESLTTIDVNTGRYVGKNDQEETVLRTNLEAAKRDRRPAPAAQHRRHHRHRLHRHGERRAPQGGASTRSPRRSKADKARTNILRISELGLVEMTRKRTRESLAQRLCEPCPTCNQRGLVKAVATTAYEVLRRIRREATMNAPVQQVVVAPARRRRRLPRPLRARRAARAGARAVRRDRRSSDTGRRAGGATRSPPSWRRAPPSRGAPRRARGRPPERPSFDAHRLTRSASRLGRPRDCRTRLQQATDRSVQCSCRTARSTLEGGPRRCVRDTWRGKAPVCRIAVERGFGPHTAPPSNARLNWLQAADISRSKAARRTAPRHRVVGLRTERERRP